MVLLMWLDRWICGIKGHQAMLRCEPGRLSLWCHACGWQSAGWQFREPQKVVRVSFGQVVNRYLLRKSA